MKTTNNLTSLVDTTLAPADYSHSKTFETFRVILQHSPPTQTTRPSGASFREPSTGTPWVQTSASDVDGQAKTAKIGSQLHHAIIEQNWSVVNTIAAHIEPDTFNEAVTLFTPDQTLSAIESAAKADDLSLLDALIESMPSEQLEAAFNNNAESLLNILNTLPDLTDLHTHLLDNFSLDFLNSASESGLMNRPLMHLAMTVEFKPSVLGALLTRGLNFNITWLDKTPLARLGFYSSPLLFRLSNNDQQKGELLLAAGADINALDNRGLTPLTQIIRRLPYSGGYERKGLIGRYPLSTDDNQRAKAPIVAFFLKNGADPFIGQITAENAAYSDRWPELDNPSDQYDYQNYTEHTGHIPVQPLLAPYIEARAEFSDIAPRLSALMRNVNASAWFNFVEYVRSDDGLDINQLKLFNRLSGAFEGRKDWNEFLGYVTLYGDIISDRASPLPDTIGQGPHENAIELKFPMEFNVWTKCSVFSEQLSNQS